MLAQVTRILKNAKQENSFLTISFDPGSEYCRNPTLQVKEAINLSSYLFLNWNEFCQLTSIIDDTDAGDIFAAGFIGTSLIPALSFDMRTTMLLCARLVKAKLGFTGCDGEKIYEQIVQQVLNEIQQRESTNIGNVGRTCLSEAGSFFLGVFSSSFIQFLISRLIK